MMEVKIFHISGADIISMYEENGDIIELYSPMLIAMTERGLAMMPFMMYNDDHVVDVRQSSIVATCSAQPALEKEYRVKVSPIQIASSSIIA